MTDTTRRRHRITDPALARLSVVVNALAEMDDYERTNALCWLSIRFGFAVPESVHDHDDETTGDDQPSLLDTDPGDSVPS